MLDDAVKAHKPHPRSLLHEESKEAYNEDGGRQAFGDEFIDEFMEKWGKFKGDWWHLALLVRNLEEDKQNPDIKDEDRLKAWNEWREASKHVGYDYIHLEYADLMWVHLEYADLRAAHLEHAYLYGAHLEHANLYWTHLEDANLAEANLEHADLGEANLEHASLWQANLEHADLRWAHLEHANLEKADLRGAGLSEANLEHSDVRWAKGLRFDGNRVEGIRIEGNAPDPWSVLRRQYTGPWFFVHLLLLAIFFAPYVGHALYLTAKSRFQEWSMEQYNTLGERAADLPGLPEYHAELQRRFFEEHEQRRAVWVLLGLHRGFLPVALAAIVVLYNAVRGFLTLRVSLLRDAEERSRTTPDWDEYKWLHKTHLVARILLLVAVAAVVYNTLVWMVETWIWVPVRP